MNDEFDILVKACGTAFDEMKSVIEYEYGVKVHVIELDPSITGDLDGTMIAVRKDLPKLVQLPLLGHLFGHTVQINISDALRVLGGMKFGPHNLSPELLELIRAYETDASRHAVQLLHDIGRNNLDQWFSDWVTADLKYLQEVYQSEKRFNFFGNFLPSFMQKYFVPEQPLLAPLAIPSFVPQEKGKRSAF